MKRVTATELKQNFGQYLELAREEKIMITKNGKVVAVMAPPGETEGVYRKIRSARDLFGVLPKEGMTLDEARMERLQKKCGY